MTPDFTGGPSTDMPQWHRKSAERMGSGNVWHSMNVRPVRGRATRIRGRYFLSVFMLSMGALLVFLTSALTAQAEELILPLLNNQIQDEPAQQRTVERLRSLPTTQSLDLVRINVDALRGATAQLSIPNIPLITLSKSYDNTTDASNFTWYGTLAGTPGQATLVVHDNNLTGLIQDGETLYSIEPIGSGAHALIKVDQGRFLPEDTSSLKEIELQSSSPETTVAPRKRQGGGPLGIGVLVAYTTAAHDKVNDIDGLIRLALAETNVSYRNSKVDIRLYLSGILSVPYPDIKTPTSRRRTGPKRE